MSDIISKIYDDYYVYEDVCRIMNLNPIPIRANENFYDHINKIKKMKKYQKLLKEKKVYFL